MNIEINSRNKMKKKCLQNALLAPAGGVEEQTPRFPIALKGGENGSRYERDYELAAGNL